MRDPGHQALPKRDQIPEEMKWRLEDIYASHELWEQDYNEVKNLIPQLEGYKGKLKENANTLLEVLRLRDQMMQINEKLYVYAHMRKDEDNTNTVYQALADRSEGLAVQVQKAAAYIVPEILAIPEDVLKDYVNQEGLELYGHFLDELVRMRPHTLSAEEEQIVALAGEIAQAPRNIFRMLVAADTKFPRIVDEDGKEVEVTEGRYIQLLKSKDRRVRKEVLAALLGTYAKNKNTLAALLNASVKKDIFHARVRKYPSALASSLHADNIPPDVYENLISTVRGRLDLMYRYVALRKRMLGLEELHMYDLYTPMVHDVRMDFSFRDALREVAKGLEPLGEEYRKTLQEGFSSRWIDALENEGKTSGAYSWGAYGTHPYVLLNYKDSLDNVFTLAHEMGHALHTYYSTKEQPYVYGSYTIFVAEVASTVNEALLMEHLLKVTPGRQEKMFLLNHYMEQFRGTVYRQTMFAEFEKIIHEKAEVGEALTPEAISGIYRQLNLEYYGPDTVVDQEIDMEWARIPHFYTPFYVYKYATGFSAATALARKILEEGEPAVARYMDFLQGGSADYPLNLLQRAGVDMSSPQPIAEALGVFEQVLTQMEQLANG
ncbi:oligopeptidase PepB [Clostridiales bacterium PH28_bin88]|nr:oligopeptidase PepB [Clostridiales bacterium PH28_bin88]